MEISTKLVCDSQDKIIDLLQACGPAHLSGMANEIFIQTSGVTKETAPTYAVLALADLIRAGSVEQYDDTSAFELTDEFYEKRREDDGDPDCEDDGKDFETLKYRA